MRGQTVTFVALMSIFIMIVHSSEARDFGDLTKDASYIMEVIDCVLERRVCDSYGAKVKALIPEALNNNCKRCSYDQKRKFKMMSTFMKTAYPDQWQQIQEKYRVNNYVHSDY